VELVTHALLGTAAGLAMRGTTRLPHRDCVSLACAGALFPDIDFLGFLVSPLLFLAHWHQAATHSLLLIPLWGGIAGGLYSQWRSSPDRLAAAALLFSVGVATHVCLDLLTAYGTMLLYPISNQRFSLNLLYVIDPLLTMAVGAGLLALLHWRRVPAFLAASSLAGGYLALTAYAHAQALELARSAPADGMVRWDVFPQPFSPFNWKLIATNGIDHQVAHVNLLGHPSLVPSFLEPWAASASAFRPPAALTWSQHSLRPPASDPQRQVAQRLWLDTRFEPFRRFATHPAIDDPSTRTTECIWFTDLRYDLPGLPATFRYGFCPAANGAHWELHRLRYFSTARQRLWDAPAR
jgi:inner membrane protein